MKRITQSVIISITLLASCSSKNGDEISFSDVLTDGIWTSIMHFEDLDEDGTFVKTGEECNEDNTWEFKTNGEMVSTEGPILCEPDEPIGDIMANWHLEDDDETLVLEFFADDLKFRIEKLDEHELILIDLSANDPNGPITQKVILNR